MRQIILDTETTGLEPSQGHRIIEIGCIEMVDRRRTGNDWQQYLNPDREVEAGAIEIHGITNEMLADKPRFGDVAHALMDYLRGAELIIHNAPFDTGFLNNELALLGDVAGLPKRVDEICTVTDSLREARRRHPGQKNDLDSLCRRYFVDNGRRTRHGALLDAEILSDVYLAMTGGQTSMLDALSAAARPTKAAQASSGARLREGGPLRVLRATESERAAHDAWLVALDRASGSPCVFRTIDPA